MLALAAAGTVLFLSERRRVIKNGLFLNARHVWICSICTHSYINTRDEKISVCPRCGSYNSRDTDIKLSEKS